MIPAVMPTYARYDIAFEKGEGVYLWDSKGRRYLDFGRFAPYFSIMARRRASSDNPFRSNARKSSFNSAEN